MASVDLTPFSHKDPNMESIQEIFRCFICMENLRDARMCPKCSKLCCRNCISRWLETRPQCPHCRSSLHVHELVNCRWAEEVTQQLDNLQAKPKKLGENGEFDFEPEKCETHGREELTVYCLTCKKAICHECALWSQQHANNHTFKPLNEIYMQHVQDIRDKVTGLRRRLMEIIGGVQDMEKNIDVVRNAKEQKVREIRNAVELMISRLDAQLKTKLMSLVSQKGALSRQVEDVEAVMHDIESTMANVPKSHLIGISDRLLNLIQEGIDRSEFSIPSISADFQSELVPTYDSATFEIKNYSRLREVAEPFHSDPLIANGHSWRLKIYPDGNGVVRGSFLSVFLELSKGRSESAKYEYRIEMVYQLADDPTKNMVREFTSDFEASECWGYNRFFRIDLLESEGYLDVATDTIKLKFDVRTPTYFQKSRQQEWYIGQVEAKMTQQEEDLNEMKQRLETLETDMALEGVDSVDNVCETFEGDADEEEQNQRDKPKLRKHGRVQMIQLLDLTDNNDTEETVSEPGSDVENELDDDNEGEEDGEGNVLLSVLGLGLGLADGDDDDEHENGATPSTSTQFFEDSSPSKNES